MYTYKCKLIKVIDGDTVDCIIDLGFSIQHKVRVRLAGIDTPETRTRDLDEKKRGLEAKHRVEELINKNNSKFIIKTEYDRTGKYGRVIGTIFLSSESESLNDLLVTEGHA